MVSGEIKRKKGIPNSLPALFLSNQMASPTLDIYTYIYIYVLTNSGGSKFLYLGDWAQHEFLTF